MSDIKESTLDFESLWNTFVTNWKWFLISVISFVLLAGIYLWFTPTQVNVKGKIQITNINRHDNPMSMGASMLNALPMGLGSSLGVSGIESEKEILMSTALVRHVVNELNLHTEYRLCHWGQRTLLYQNQPVNVSVPLSYLQWFDDQLPVNDHQIILFISKDSEGYTVETTLKKNKMETQLPDQTFTRLPATIKTGKGTLTLTENTLLSDEDRELYETGYTIKVTVSAPTSKAISLAEHLTIEKTDMNANDMAYIIMEDESVVRGIDLINHLAEVFNRFTNNEKNEEAQKTEEFVNERLAKIDMELGASDDAWENSKKSFQITNPTVDAQEVIEKKSIYESKMVEIGTQLQLHDYLSDYINNPDNLFEIIPVGLGIFEDTSAGMDVTSSTSQSSLIAQHNGYVNQRKQLLKSMSDKAPEVQRLTESIRELHPILQTAMRRGRQNILMKREAAQREYNKYMGRVNTAPKMERVLTEIGRQREIKQEVYLMLLQKREETAMTLANTTDKCKLIDDTLMVKKSNHPKKSIVLLAAFVLGLIFPMPIFFFRLVFNSKN